MATIYLPASKEKVPVFIYFHGGGFIFGNREGGLEETIKNKLLANQIAVVSADYRLVPETKLKEILEDASDIVRWIKVNVEARFNIDTTRVAVGGGSAGGYLALSTGYKGKYTPDAIVAISSPTGFSTEGLETGDLSLIKNIKKDSIISHGDYSSRMDVWRYLSRNGLALYETFGFDPLKEPEKLEPYTLTANIKQGYPPLLIIHAKNDRAVKLSEAENLYAFLQAKKVKSQLYVVENGHSSELIRQHPEAVDEMVAFLKKSYAQTE